MVGAIIINGTVTNIIEVNSPNALSLFNAISIGDVYVKIGDMFIDGAFYRDNVRLLSPQEETQATIAELDETVVALEYQNALYILGFL